MNPVYSAQAHSKTRQTRPFSKSTDRLPTELLASAHELFEKILLHSNEILALYYHTQLYPLTAPFQEFLGYAAEEIVAQKKPLLTLIHPQDYDDLDRFITNENQKPSRIYVNRIRWINNEGHTKRTRTTFSRLQISYYPDVFLISIKDIPALGSTKNKVNNYASIGNAAAIIHDLKNYITIIEGHAQQARQYFDKLHPAGQALEEMTKCASNASDLIRGWRHQQEVAPDIGRNGLHLPQAMELMKQQIIRILPENITMTITTGTKLPKLDMSSSDFRRLMLNIADNAGKAMPKGGTLSVSALLSPKDKRYIRITVRDTGIGVSSDMMVRILRNADKKEQMPVVGVGIKIVRDIVLKTGGWIAVRSTPGEGTTFEIDLPAKG